MLPTYELREALTRINTRALRGDEAHALQHHIDCLQAIVDGRTPAHEEAVRMHEAVEGAKALNASLRERISALEKERDAAWSERASAIAEKHAALADNAALLQALCAAKEALGKAQVNIPWGTPPRLACGLAYDAVPVAVAHPGAALLEEHRRALVRARNEGLEDAAARVKDDDVAEMIRAMKEPEPPVSG